MVTVPEVRIRQVNPATVNADGAFVLYWMTAFRRAAWNFSLQRAAEWASQLNKPLVIAEPLPCGHRWACDRFHQFVLQGMQDNARALTRKPVTYYPYVEPRPGASLELLAALAGHACLVISDDFPTSWIPDMLAAAQDRLPVSLELIDSNGMLPLRATDRVFRRAFDFRRFLQNHLRPHLDEMPEPDPLAGHRLQRLAELPPDIARHWPAADLVAWTTDSHALASLPIDHGVCATPLAGGARAARGALRTFLERKLVHYATRRNEPEQDVTSGLSPYLHFGHLSVHQVFVETMIHDQWSLSQIGSKATGSSSGWWHASAEVESFWDELITWREVGYNMCHHRRDFDQYESLPDWARATLAAHATDPRPHLYSLERLEAADTHDPLWNAAQTQLRQEGRIHNYLRMLWGKKILEWSRSPQAALEHMIELNNKYGLDGSNPNSYSGIFWVLGRYDRAWGPERPIYGKIRYMRSENTARKVRVRDYIRRFAAPPEMTRDSP